MTPHDTFRALLVQWRLGLRPLSSIAAALWASLAHHPNLHCLLTDDEWDMLRGAPHPPAMTA